MNTNQTPPPEVLGSPSGSLVLWLRLTDPGENYYWHCRKRKKMPAIDAPVDDFVNALWPGRGLKWMTACDCNEVARRITAPGTYEVECGEYHITARLDHPANSELTPPEFG